jgi:predicted XRE-type DNA-binding protein
MAHEETIREIVLQEMNEERFNRKHIDAKIRKFIEENPVMQRRLAMGVEMVKDYMSKTYSYTTKDGTVKVLESKMKRIEQLKGLDLEAMVLDIFIGVAYYPRPEMFTSVTAQMSSRLGFSDRTEAITTVAELLAVLCMTDAFDIFKETKMGSLKLQSTIDLPETLIEFIENSQFLPPMVCEPLPVTHNYCSGYLTHNDSLILGSGNHHDGDLCLDVINTMGKVALSLDLQFLCKVEERPTYELDTAEKAEQWLHFKKQSYIMYDLMAQQGNRFHLNHKVDKRGRIYSHGYHINPQSAAFKKAMLEFADAEVVEGVPT